jgi:hypothetical protein
VLSTLRFFRHEYEELLQPVETYMGGEEVVVDFEK